ncbi:MAG: 4Fe-4S dicluster domain-containing protein [Anaerolineaceae bacterium]|nr:4Fe-4S dicluster domain-containing protein [Anaerolineaceae bacterium]
MSIPFLLLLIIGVILTSFTLIFMVVSIREKEPRAARLALMLAAAEAILFSSILFLLSAQTQQFVLWGLAGLAIIGVIVYHLPIGRWKEAPQMPEKKIDERTIMFARMRLQTGTPEYEAYYKMHPKHKAGDERIRARGWGGRNGLHVKVMEMAAEASFAAVGSLRDVVHGEAATEKIEIPEEERTDFILNLAKHFGALNAGITRLEPYHIYSHVGRGAGEWGEEINLPHTYAIAITTEMNYENVMAAPRQPNMAETACQYANIGLTAVQLADAIRRMGYEACAHIDGNYRVLCPLVARDAGLGEIGRMGLLMTPDIGSRVRIAVVTTTMELKPHVYEPVTSVIDFCLICKKCAEICPSQSISYEDRTMVNGALRWQINQQTCYEYWTMAGTDCGRCMAVCPYSHDDHWMHGLIRKGIQHSGAFRRIALRADDVLYGRKPEPKPAPEWIRRIDMHEEK